MFGAGGVRTALGAATPRETAPTGWGPANAAAIAAAGGIRAGTTWAQFEGVRNGTGTSYVRNGQKTYDGQWKNGKREGTGTSFDYGDKEYEGEWKDDKQNGTGTLYYGGSDERGEQRVLYEGEWRDNLQWGQGTQYDEEGNIVHQGEWEDGLPYPS